MKSWFHLDSHNGTPMYLQLKEQVKTAVAGGALRPGDQMPSVRELASTLAVNPNTVARAYNDLEREGLLLAERGRGTFVANRNPLLEEKERLMQLKSSIDKLLVEAYSLKVSSEQLAVIWEERLQAWKERLQVTKKEERQ